MLPPPVLHLLSLKAQGISLQEPKETTSIPGSTLVPGLQIVQAKRHHEGGSTFS